MPTEIETLKAQVKELQELVGLAYLKTPPPPGLTADQLKAHFQATWTVKENELPSGRYPLGIGMTENAFILADIRKQIGASVPDDPDDTQVPDDSTSTPVDTQAIINQVTANVLAALAAGATSDNPGALSAEDAVGGGHFAELSFGRLLLKANTQRKVVQGGINDEFQVEFDCNGWDSGSKRKRNYNCVGSKKRPSSADGPNGYGSFEHSTWPPVENEDPTGDYAGWNRPDWHQPYGPIFDRNGVKVERFYRGHGFVVLQGEQQINDAFNNKIAQRRVTASGPQRQGWSHLRFVCPKRPGQQDDNGAGGTPENLACGGEDGSPGVSDRSFCFVNDRLHRIKMRADMSLYAEPVPAGYFNP